MPRGYDCVPRTRSGTNATWVIVGTNRADKRGGAMGRVGPKISLLIMQNTFSPTNG